MAIKKNQLLESLDDLRDKLKSEYFQKNGKDTLICTDDALKEIARKKPLKASDFLAIAGLERDFIDKYANDFLNIINRYRKEMTKEVKVSDSAYKVLHHYKDRLTNISKTNPNLYMGKTEKIRSFDLYQLKQNEEIVNFLTNSRIKVLKLNSNTETIEKDITTLYRETNKSLREKGSYNLYVAYPYVEGIFKKERFAIKAPLLYFPVKLERNKRDFTLRKDLEKDIIFNRDLLLATSKIESSNSIDSNMPQISNFDISYLKQVVIPYYEKNGFVITNKANDFDFIEFKNELKDDFVKNTYDDFELKPYITLGRYQLYSSMIQKDMDTILSGSKYNELLEGLIDEDNLYKEEKNVVFNNSNEKVLEEEISYINSLNDAQEQVIDLLNREKKVVIWGPPGTGKSQTITSLIAASILKGENVLIVSEKKVALDVIYSRLKNASKYVMFVDDAENKQNFYEKLKGFLDPMPPVRTRNNDIFTLEQEISDITTALDKSIELLYGNNGASISTIYERYLKDKDVINELTPQSILKMFNRNFNNKLSFKDLSEIEKTFDKDNELKEYLEYEKILSKYPLINKLETKISRSGKIELMQFNEIYNEYINNSNNLSFFAKLSAKNRFIKENSERLLFLTSKKNIDKKYLKLLLNDNTLHQYLLDNTLKLDKYKTKHEQLTNLDIKYLQMLLTDELVANYSEIHKQRKYLFDAVYTGYLEDFKAKNQKYLYMVDEYIEKIKKLNELIEEKMYVTTESFEMELYRHALNFSNTKRIMDIKRILEANNKPSIKAFIDIFQPEMMDNIKIWMMTPEVVSAIVPLLYGMFDLVIFDEASQMYVEKGIPAIYRAKKVVIAGDPKQLRPSSLGIGRVSEEDELFEDNENLKDMSLDAKSLLDLARYKYRESLLNYHYRSVYEELIAFSNHAFYDGKLIVSPNQMQSKKPPIEYVYVEDGLYDNKRNHEEAKAVVELIKKVFRQRKDNETIGVITFNSTQRDLIENYIDQEIFKKGTYQRKFEKEMFRVEGNEDQSLFIKNIENVQGDERDIIIFSMGYAKDKSGSVKRRFGWLNHEGGQNRLNVAITRAKKKIYFVSSLYPEEFKVDDLQSLGPKLLKDFMRYCYFVSNKNNDLAKTVLEQLHTNEKTTKNTLISHLANDVKSRLERNGFKVNTSIGIGEYNINLGIYDDETNSYSLGIICDINDPSNANARKDLLHQEKYLKSRNWNIYRVFSSNWYINSNKELKQIKEAIKKV